MDDYLEIEKDTITLKSINLDDFSIEDLKEYIEQLKKEIERVKNELEKKLISHIEAEKYLQRAVEILPLDPIIIFLLIKFISYLY